MNAALLLALFAPWGGLVDVEEISLPDPASVVFVADFDLDGQGEVAVLSPGRLEVYGRGQRGARHTITLPETTSVVDVFDAGGEGPVEVVAIAGDAIVRIPLDPAGAEAIPCFTRENQYSPYRGAPFPGVLAIMRDGIPLVALPCREALELRAFDGQLVDSYPIGIDAPRRLALGQPFSAWSSQHAQLGPSDALEFRVSSVAAYKPLLPEDALPLEIAAPSGRLGTPRQQREATALDPERWPWFPVNASETDEVRALYARTGDPGGQTSIRIRDIRVTEDGDVDGGGETGPERHYPGLMIHHPVNLPDFDGDGFHDLLLWKPVRVSPTVDSLTRAMAQGTWPIHIIAHTYAPARRRFDARPWGHLKLDVPVAWYLAAGTAGPLKTVFLHDVNGDGRTDFGGLLDSQTLALWLSRPGGFGSTPDFQHRFSAQVTSVELEMDLEGKGRATVALRSEDTLFLLRPVPPVQP